MLRIEFLMLSSLTHYRQYHWHCCSHWMRLSSSVFNVKGHLGRIDIFGKYCLQAKLGDEVGQRMN